MQAGLDESVGIMTVHRLEKRQADFLKLWLTGADNHSDRTGALAEVMDSFALHSPLEQEASRRLGRLDRSFESDRLAGLDVVWQIDSCWSNRRVVSMPLVWL